MESTVVSAPPQLVPFVVLVAGRSLDLLGTAAASPDLSLESNAWMRRLGWRWTVLLYVVFLAAMGLFAGPHTWIWLGVFSALLGLRNAQLAWTARALTAGGHADALARWVRAAPLPALLLPLGLESGILVVLGAFVADGSTVREHETLWYLADVGRGILVFGVFAGILRGFEIRRLRAAGAGGQGSGRTSD